VETCKYVKKREGVFCPVFFGLLTSRAVESCLWQATVGLDGRVLSIFVLNLLEGKIRTSRDNQRCELGLVASKPLGGGTGWQPVISALALSTYEETGRIILYKTSAG
jgi:hypothetical protein